MAQNTTPAKSAQPSRVRFAPSPPGPLGLEGARTALFNWLFARQRRGKFILRIDDADPAASGPETEKALLRDLKWLGLDWDEGPDIGGERGPYRQSERLAGYVDRAMRLLHDGLAYRCFCTEENLREDAERALAAGMPPCYSGRCEGIPGDESDKRAEAGEHFAVRFMVPGAGEVVVNDIIRGRVALSVRLVDDFVILSSSGLPTYNFAAVLDDSSMEITHVLRGQERLRSTLRQVLLYGAMGLRLPEFGHLPPIVGPDKEALDKRRFRAHIEWLREQGYLPEALVNYLALLGWSPEGAGEIMDLEGLTDSFSITGVTRDAAVFDSTKLSWMNAHYLRTASDDELWRLAEGVIPAKWIESAGVSKAREAALLVRKRVRRLNELPGEMAPLFEYGVDEEAAAVLKRESVKRVLRVLLAELRDPAHMSADEFLALLDRVRERSSSSKKTVFLSVRAAVTGKLEGPELGAAAVLLGVGEVRDRVARALGLG